MIKKFLIFNIFIISFLAFASVSFSQDKANDTANLNLQNETVVEVPKVSLDLDGTKLGTDGTVSSTIKLVALISILAFAPAMILTMTCFTRIAVVLSMTRTSLGTQQAPPNMIITGLALFLTFSKYFQQKYFHYCKLILLMYSFPYYNIHLKKPLCFQNDFCL